MENVDKVEWEKLDDINESDKPLENNRTKDLNSIISHSNTKKFSAVRVVEDIIRNAVCLDASDIHIEPFEGYIKIRYRIDGELFEYQRLPNEILDSLVSRLKVMADIDIAEKRTPKDGRIIEKFDDRQFDFRVSTLPGIYGEKIVIRILNKSSILLGKNKLGISDDDIKRIDNMLKANNGIIFVTGPTGSGKTTTLYTIMKELNRGDKNIVTIEDPVEYTIEGINHVNVNPKAGLGFASGLRAILRQDPDIILIGEIRDRETAEIAVRAAITGHLVLSTLHTYDCASSVIRLMDIGIEPYLIAASVAGFISQRLVRKICEHCKREYSASSYEKIAMGMKENEQVVLYKGCGCSRCSGTGYRGRTGIFEVMEITRELKDIIMANKNVNTIKDFCLSKGMRTLKDSCLMLLLSGLTTFEEYIRITYLEE